MTKPILVPVEPEFKGPLIHHQAWWTFDPEVNAYYFAPSTRTSPPYLKQITVEAIVDVASDGTLAGIELLDAPPPPSIAAPKPVPAEEEIVARAIFDWEKRGLGFDFEALDSGAKSQWLEAGKLVLSALAHHRDKP